MTRATVKLKVLGVAFLCLLLAGVWVTYGLFSQKFTHFDEVTLDASTIGLQMPERADVKIRGVIVGEVLGFEVTDQGARSGSASTPSQIDSIPANVTGAIVPKTLFGEKYVSLVVPQDPSAQPLQPGATVRPTAIPTEVQKVLADLYPLLRTVQPADLNTTLNAHLHRARGPRRRARPGPGHRRPLPEAHQPADPGDRPGPPADHPGVEHLCRRHPRARRDPAQHDRTTGTSRTGTGSCRPLFTDVTSFSDTAHDFLRDNGDNIIRLGQVSAPTAHLLARYSPEYPCLLRGLVDAAAGARPRRSAASPSTSCSRPCPTSRAATPPPTGRCTATTAAPPACT